jgi:YebC/PmpR family DNA-binding regulatory protein
LTDNRNRTLADVRRVLNKAGGNMAEAGAVSWMFSTKGYILIERKNQDPDEVFMTAVEAGAEDVEINKDSFEIYTAAADLHAVSTVLAAAGLKAAEAELSQIPKNEIQLDQKETVQVMGLIEALEDLDDIQRVYSGLSISDEAIAELELA